jgi:chromosome segregation ATPase
VLKIQKSGRISDPAWAKRFLYLVLRNVVFIDDSLMEHAAELSGYKADFILGCATELRERLEDKRRRYTSLQERRNSLHVKIMQLKALISEETDAERLARYKKQLESAETRIKKTKGDIRSASLLPTHRDIAEVLGQSKGSVDSGLYYLKQAFDDLQKN